jgi:uncharacterized cupin superfamily protein
VTDPHLLCPDAATVALAPLPLDPEDVVAGTPRAGLAELGTVGAATVGVWELTEGTVRDTEVDEVFVVIGGAGTVRFADGSSVELEPGAVVRLRAGERTEWEVRARLRKVYVTA